MKTKLAFIAVITILVMVASGCFPYAVQPSAGYLDGWGVNGRSVYPSYGPITSDNFLFEQNDRILVAIVDHEDLNPDRVGLYLDPGFGPYVPEMDPVGIEFCAGSLTCILSNPALARGLLESFYVSVTINDSVLGSPFIAMTRFTSVASDVQDLKFGGTGTGFVTTQAISLPEGYTFTQASSFVADSKGNIYLAGTLEPAAGSESLAKGIILRFTSAGLLDAKFTGGGKLIFDIDGAATVLNRLYIQPDNKLVALGSYLESGIPHPYARRFSAKGSVDFTDTMASTQGEFRAAFTAANGTVYLAGGNAEGNVLLVQHGSAATFDPLAGAAYSLALQADGKLLVGGTTDSQFFVARYLADGTLDAEFGTAGKVLTSFDNLPLYDSLVGDFAVARQLHVLSGGRIFAGGYLNVGTPANSMPAMALYESTGSLAGFGIVGIAEASTMGGKQSMSSNMIGAGQEFAIQGDGIIFAKAEDTDPIETYYEVVLTRMNANGLVDTNFDLDGDPEDPSVYLSVPDAIDNDTPLVVTNPDGWIYAAWNYGTLVEGTSYDNIALARLDPDGAIDVSFECDTGLGEVCDGILTPPELMEIDSPEALALQSNESGDKILVMTSDHGDIFPISTIWRLGSDGQLDTTFGTGGALTIALPDPSLGCYAVAMTVDELSNIFVAGVYGTGMEFLNGTHPYVGKYGPDGTPDAGFTLPNPTSDPLIGFFTDITVRPSGVIYATGVGGPLLEFNTDALLARYQPDGTLDPTFGTGGIAVVDVYNELDWTISLTVQPDGKIVTGGMALKTETDEFSGEHTDLYPMLLRFTPVGILDPTFGVEGRSITSTGQEVTTPNFFVGFSQLAMHGEKILGTIMGSMVFQFIADPITDETPPLLAPTFSQRTPFLTGSRVTVAANASDPESGIEYQYCGAVDTALEGTFTVTCTAVNGVGLSDSMMVDYTVAGVYVPMMILPETLEDGVYGTYYSQQLEVYEETLGASTYTFSVFSGALPANLTLSHSGLLSGIPEQIGTFPFTVMVQDSAGGVDYKDYTLTVGKATPTITFTSSSNPSITGQYVDISVTVTGYDKVIPTGSFTVWSLDFGFMCNGTLINGTGTCSIYFSTPGSYRIYVDYVPEFDPYYDGATIGLDQQVNDPSADLGITIVDSKDPIRKNANLTYTITVTNYGPSNGINPVVTINYDLATTYVSVVAPGWTCPVDIALGQVICTAYSLVSGGSSEILLTVTAPPTPGGLLHITANVTNDTLDPFVLNNDDEEYTMVGGK